MNLHRKTLAASVAPKLPPKMGTTADCPQQAGDRGAPANPSIGATCNLLPVGKRVEPLTVEAGAPSLHNEQYGPPTTNSPEGAGGPRNRWDREIAHWRAVGKPHLAEGLQMARARIAIAFERLEPVWVPTDAQMAMFRLRAGAAANGLCTTKAA